MGLVVMTDKREQEYEGKVFKLQFLKEEKERLRRNAPDFYTTQRKRENGISEQRESASLLSSHFHTLNIHRPGVHFIAQRRLEW